MAAYVIVEVEITDPREYEEYKRQVPPTIVQFGGKFLVRGGRVETLEGGWLPQRLVVLEFDSVERAKAWWSSAAYAPAKQLRQRSSICRMIVVEGVE